MYDETLSGYGSFSFIDRNVLLGTKRNLLLPNDVLTISCELTAARLEDDIGSELTELNQYQPQRTTILNTESLSNDLKSLYNNDMFSDLTLRVGNEDLQLHSAFSHRDQCVS
ncbi:TD and POZ domain-containing protein 4 [Caerostris extrusa]|uniref:TD and POZ domain-containing protein 4 n=1 Tax=Caerostris extrusa TaxID=172846 RepID=A0AAV4XC03_CAEEX|nr:TD and POZ domain-containing protein 4 [Caerostris extrusa]